MIMRHMFGWHLIDMTYVYLNQTAGLKKRGEVLKDRSPFDSLPSDVSATECRGRSVEKTLNEAFNSMSIVAVFFLSRPGTELENAWSLFLQRKKKMDWVSGSCSWTSYLHRDSNDTTLGPCLNPLAMNGERLKTRIERSFNDGGHARFKARPPRGGIVQENSCSRKRSFL